MIGVVVLMTLAIWRIPHDLKRSRQLIEQWASAHGLEVVQVEMQPRFGSPFAFKSTKLQTVYRVRFRDRDGATRQAWVRCGSPFIGLLSDRVDVRWEGDS